MLIGFNIVVILLTIFIAYWWANQGLFSALLHLLCVIVAGALALAFWEPLAGVLITGGKGDPYWWGVTLLLLFAVSLLVLRFGMDRLAPANVTMPHWANLSFGGALGMCAGVLTMGMFIIGSGFIQSTYIIAGFKGYGRESNGRQVEELNTLWLPVNKMTSSFYEWLSVTSLNTRRPLRHYSPNLAAQASLVRDSYKNGRGQLALDPDGAEIGGLLFCVDDNRYGVIVAFGNSARDFGEQLTLSSSQIRLIERKSGTGAVRTVHPDRWSQHSGLHQFDDPTHYITSETGKQSANVVVEFATPTDFDPRFIQIRNTRFELPQRQDVPCSMLRSGVGGGTLASDMNFNVRSIAPHIRVHSDLRPISMGKNNMPAGLRHVDGFLTEGTGAVQRGAPRANRKLAIQGYYEPKGSRVVKLDVSRRTAADLAPFAEQEGETGRIALVDNEGNEYAPYGYILERRDEYEIKLEPSRLLAQYQDLPKLPSAGSQKLELLFHVTEGSTIVGLRYGDTAIGGCSLVVPAAE
jgi:hypothetical protein